MLSMFKKFLMAILFSLDVVIILWRHIFVDYCLSAYSPSAALFFCSSQRMC